MLPPDMTREQYSVDGSNARPDNGSGVVYLALLECAKITEENKIAMGFRYKW
jgi:hypothetical protein